MKNIGLILFLFGFTFSSIAQIELGTKTPKEVKEKQDKTDKSDVSPGVKVLKMRKGSLGDGNLSIYLGFSPTYSFRNLSGNSSIFGEELGERSNEVPSWVYSGNIGVRANLHKNVTLDISLGYLEDGEKYDFKSSINDSTYSYKNSFRSFAVNCKVYGRFQAGKFSFYFGGGIAPSLFINQGQKLSYTTSSGTSTEEKLKFTEGYNAFNLHLIGSVGVSYQIFDIMSIYFLPEYRYGLFSSYAKQAPYVRKPIGLGLHFGLTVDF